VDHPGGNSHLRHQHVDSAPDGCTRTLALLGAWALYDIEEVLGNICRTQREKCGAWQMFTIKAWCQNARLAAIFQAFLLIFGPAAVALPNFDTEIISQTSTCKFPAMPRCGVHVEHTSVLSLDWDGPRWTTDDQHMFTSSFRATEDGGTREEKNNGG